MSRERLEKWVNRMVTDLTDEGPVVRFELWHAVDGLNSTRLETIAIPSLPTGPSKPNEDGEEEILEAGDAVSGSDIVDSFMEAAESDAATRMGSPQRYVSLAFRAEKTDEHSASFAFLIRPSREARLGDDSEPGTERGVTAHVLRHNENVHRLLMQASETMLGRACQELERERGRREKAENFRDEFVLKYQELMDRTTERRIHEARELQKAKRLDELMGVVTAMVPLALAKFLPGAPGVPSLPGAQDPTAMGVQKIFGNMSEKELMGVLQALDGPNRMAVMQLYEQMRERDAAERAEKPEILQ